MRINGELCSRCGKCRPTCPVAAIALDKETKRFFIDQDRCVECEVCLRSGVCPENALERVELTWPRTVRAVFSNPLLIHEETRIPGRGTEEMKTNDVTGRFRPGQVGLAVEMGRPGVSTSFADVQKVAMVCARHGVDFEPKNPVTGLMIDPATGELNPEVLAERALSAIIEFELPQAELAGLLADLKIVAGEIDTVFSLNAIQICSPDGRQPMLDILGRAGFSPSPNGKSNLGLGRPAFEFDWEGGAE